MTDELAPRLSAQQIVATYERAERDIRAGFALIAGAERNLSDALLDGVHVRDSYNRHCMNFDEPGECLVEVRRQVWQALVERLELRRFMSIEAWEQLQKQLREKEVPEITAETVAGMAKQFSDRMPEMLEAAVREVHDWLRPRGGSYAADYKTNDQVEVGRKVILTYGVERWATNWHVNHYIEPKLTALENVMTALDGRGSITKTHYSAVSTAIKALPSGATCEGETDYFRFRGFKNRNLHLEFKREDLLARFNAVAGGARLRP